MRRLSLALLLVFASPALAQREDARVDTERRLDKLEVEVADFRATTGELPATRDGVDEIASEPELLVDAWGHEIKYVRIAGGFWLMSWGADGAPGGDGEAADVVHVAR